MVSLAQKLKWPKTSEKRFCKHVRVVLCKKPLEKSPNIQKWDHFENRPSCKGYRLCKMVSLAQKFKSQKRAKNDFASKLELFCAKNRLKKHQIFEKWDHFENRPSCKAYRLCKMVSLAQKFTWPKTCEKRFYKHVRVVLCKKPLKKHQIFQKWDHFENRPSCKGYRLCKMVSLGQKDKRPKTCEKRFYKHVTVVVCKKPLEKTPNIREMRPFWKSPIFQRLYTLQDGQFGSKIQMARNVRNTILQAR